MARHPNIWRRARIQLRAWSRDQIGPIRLASHLAVVLVVLLVALFSRMELPMVDLQPLLAQASAGATSMSNPAPQLRLQTFTADNNVDRVLRRAAVPLTEVQDRSRKDIIKYTVQPGDTAYALAQRFGVSPDTIVWANDRLERNPDMLRLGQELTILPVSGVYHKVESGDTISSIAQKYKADPATIIELEWNQLESTSDVLEVGRYLIVPGGEKPYVPPQVYAYAGPAPQTARRGTGSFIWPTTGRITQPYHSAHRAIDIGAPTGTPVRASDTGYVSYTGFQPHGYGNLIIIDHSNGYRTYYAHLSRILVRTGDSVARGATIGLVGSTGYSTGPHLHFEIRQGNVLRNPLGFLP